MFNALGHIVNLPNRLGQGNIQTLRPSNLLVNEFITQFNEQEEFITYFQENWLKKIGKFLEEHSQ